VTRIELSGELEFSSGETEYVVLKIDNEQLRANPDILRMTKGEIRAVFSRDGESVTLDGKLRVKGSGTSKVKLYPTVNLADFPELCEMLEGEVRATYDDHQATFRDDENQSKLDEEAPFPEGTEAD